MLFILKGVIGCVKKISKHQRYHKDTIFCNKNQRTNDYWWFRINNSSKKSRELDKRAILF